MESSRCISPASRPCFAASPVLSNWTGKLCLSWEATIAPASPRTRTNAGRCSRSISNRFALRQLFSAVIPLETTWSGLMEKRHSNSDEDWAVAHTASHAMTASTQPAFVFHELMDSLLLRSKTDNFGVLPQHLQDFVNLGRPLAGNGHL